MKILITGGAGFIGSHLCDRFIERGESVICLDNLLSGDIENIRPLLGNKNFRFVRGDIRDKTTLEKCMRDVDAVFHLAAQVHVDRSIIAPEETFEINVTGTQNVLETARMFDVEKVIHASTSEVYGTAQYAPIDENHPLNASHPYGASKISADRLCFAYASTYGMPVIPIRFFNVFGPRQRSIGYGGVISIFTRRVLDGIPPVIYGNGLQTRDYTYISDVVSAYEMMLGHSFSPEPETYNVGTGKEFAILEIANIIIQLCGSSLSPIYSPARPGEVHRLVANSKKIKEAFGWIAKVGFIDGVSKYIEWYKTYGYERRLKLDGY